MKDTLQTYHGVASHCAQMKNMYNISTFTNEKTCRKKKFFVSKNDLLHMTPLMHEQQDHVILEEDTKTMKQIYFQCKQQSDEEPRNIQQISDQKRNCPQGYENLT